MGGMNEKTLFQLALGLSEPWYVSETKFDPTLKRLDIYLDFHRGGTFSCPECGAGCKAYDTEEKAWRHLNFFQHEAFLHARIPRIQCRDHGVRLRCALGPSPERLYDAVRGLGLDAVAGDAGQGDRGPAG